MADFVLGVRKATETGAFGPEAGPPIHLAVPEDAPEPLARHALPDAQTWMRAVRDAATANPGAPRPVVCFVHGYNTDPREALLRQRLVARELAARALPCVLVGFDWPTTGTAAAYLHDRLEAQRAAWRLVEAALLPFAVFQTPDCPAPVHLLAHSMGAFLTREAFRMAHRSHRGDARGPWRLAQVAFVAADLSSACFAQDSPDMAPLFARCGRLTNYFSGYDRALAVSALKQVDISARAGRVGMPSILSCPAKGVDVDCGPRYLAEADRQLHALEGMVSHSWYFEDPVWYDDLAHTLRGDLDRAHIPGRVAVGENDFQLPTARV